MAESTAIEWCDSTFNPWIGCTRVSPACDDCYAARSTPARTMGIAWGPGQPRKRTSPSTWALPKRWNDAHAEFFAQHGRRRRVFCSSLADVFDNEVPPELRADLFALIDRTPNLDWLLLTKRIGNVAKMLDEVSNALALRETGAPWPPRPNVWLGATICNQAEADRDVPKLLAVPARVRFLSIEPMLGPITLPGFNATTSWCPLCQKIVADSLVRPHEGEHGNGALPCASAYDMLHWVICGGESGPKARPMHPDWARSLRDQCAAADVPFLFKQWGEWIDHEQASVPNTLATAAAALNTRPDGYDVRIGKKAAGRQLDGRTHDGFPELRHA